MADGTYVAHRHPRARPTQPGVGCKTSGRWRKLSSCRSSCRTRRATKLLRGSSHRGPSTPIQWSSGSAQAEKLSPANSLSASSSWLTRDQNGEFPAVFVQTRQIGAQPPAKVRHDRGVAGQVPRVDEVHRDVGCANVPEPHDVIEVRGITDIETGIVPLRPDGVVAAYAVACQIPEADVIVYLG